MIHVDITFMLGCTNIALPYFGCDIYTTNLVPLTLGLLCWLDLCVSYTHNTSHSAFLHISDINISFSSVKPSILINTNVRLGSEKGCFIPLFVDGRFGQLYTFSVEILMYTTFRCFQRHHLKVSTTPPVSIVTKSL